MTKQELEKAIENGESVWYALENILEEVKLNKEFFYVTENMLKQLSKDKSCNWDSAYFKDLYKTKAEAEHYFNNANITRTEKLPFVTWEEFLSGKSVNFVCRYGHEYILKKKYGNILLIWINVNNSIASWDLTEENFYKAYDKCAELFKE